MVFFVATCHQDVVQVDEKEIEPLENGVHQPLEGLCGIFEAKRHTEEFEKSKRADNGSLWNVVWVNGYLVIASDQVHFAEEDLTGQVGREIVDPRDRIPIVLRGAI